MKTPHYQLHGETIASDIPLQLHSSDQPATISLRQIPTPAQNPSATRIHVEQDFPGGPTLKVFHAKDSLAFYYADLGAIATPHEIRYWGDCDPSFPQLTFLLDRAIIPILLLWHRSPILAMHAASIATQNQGWLLLGDSGAGKSSSALSMLIYGAKFLADEVTTIHLSPRPVIHCGAPISMQRSVIPHSEQVATPSAGEAEKAALLIKPQHRTRQAPLRGLVLLQPLHSTLQSHWQPLPPARALPMVLKHCLDLQQPPRQWAQQRVKAAARLCRSIPIFLYAYPHSPSRQPAHVKELMGYLKARTVDLNYA